MERWLMIAWSIIGCIIGAAICIAVSWYYWGAYW